MEIEALFLVLLCTFVPTLVREIMTIYGDELLTIVMMMLLMLVSTVLVIREVDHPRRWSLSPSSFSICSYRLSSEYKGVATYGDAICDHHHNSLYAHIDCSRKKEGMAVQVDGISLRHYRPSRNARIGSPLDTKVWQATEMELLTNHQRASLYAHINLPRHK